MVYINFKISFLIILELEISELELTEIEFLENKSDKLAKIYDLNQKYIFNKKDEVTNFLETHNFHTIFFLNVGLGVTLINILI